MTAGQREIHHLRETNDELTTTIEVLRTAKLQQDQVIQELSRLLAART
jgi:hypothetical protein